MQVLRAASTRARITSTSFVNEYNFGDFRGDASGWMERYFDAFAYLANWGTRVIMLRLPARLLPLKTARQYCGGEDCEVWAKAGNVIVSQTSQREDAFDEEFDDDGLLSSMIAVRADLARGDMRALYLFWLLRMQNDELQDVIVEPPVPPGLDNPSAALRAMSAFLRIDEDLVQIAADSSQPQPIAGFMRRSVGQLRTMAEARTAERERRETAARDVNQARATKAANAARQRYLNGLVGQQATLWRQVQKLIATKQPKSYDLAIQLLVDLQALAAHDGTRDFAKRLQTLHAAHSGKSSFVARLGKAGLVSVG